jgi:hypothetical protein
MQNVGVHILISFDVSIIDQPLMLCHELTISLLFRSLHHLAAETVNILLIPLLDLHVFTVVKDFTFLDLLPDDIGEGFILEAL